MNVGPISRSCQNGHDHDAVLPIDRSMVLPVGAEEADRFIIVPFPLSPA